MVSKFVASGLAAASLMAAWAGSAQAAVYNLNLSGSVASASSYDFTSGATRYQGQLIFPLSGLDGSNGFDVTQGDTVNTTVTLDQPWNLPASVYNTTVILYLTSSSFLSDLTTSAVDGTTTLFDGGSTVFQRNEGVGTRGQLVMDIVLFPTDNGAFSFDSATFDFSVTHLGSASEHIDEAEIAYQLQGPGVPEPATWTMLIGGLGLAGAALRRRRQLAQI